MTVSDTARTDHRRLGAAVAFGVGLALLVTLAVVVTARSGWLHRFDVQTDAAINRWINHNRDQLWFWKGASAAGGPSAFRIAALVGAVVLLWLPRHRSAVPFVIIAVGGTILWSSVVKDIVGRSRPTVAHPVTATLTSKSFPSGHALTSFVTLAVLVVLLRPYLRGMLFALVAAVCALVVLVIGVSRLVLGVHYVTDVFGGWLLGGLWVMVVCALLSPHRELALPSPKHRIGFRG